MENENAWTIRKNSREDKEREREREKRGEKRKRRRTSDTSLENGEKSRRRRGRGAGRQCPRSCVAQRETFNSVTPGLNYHAETIVPGKIKKGELSGPAPAATVVPSQNHAQSCYKDEKEGWNMVEEKRERMSRTTTKSLFRLQDQLLRSV